MKFIVESKMCQDLAVVRRQGEANFQNAIIFPSLHTVTIPIQHFGSLGVYSFEMVRLFLAPPPLVDLIFLELRTTFT